LYVALADRGNWHPDTNSFELQRETYSHHQQNGGKPIIEMGKRHILAQAAETGFLQYKKQIPLKCVKRVQCERKTF
jgi:hypothetical protein